MEPRMNTHTPIPWRAAIDMDGRHQGFSIMATSIELNDDRGWHETKKYNAEGEYTHTACEPFGYCGLAGKP